MDELDDLQLSRLDKRTIKAFIQVIIRPISPSRPVYARVLSKWRRLPRKTPFA